MPREDAGAEESPYRGLTRFEPGDADVFFGRDQLIENLLALVRAHRSVVVLGPSGSGKSSLLRAGLIPRLSEGAGLDTPLAAIRILTPGAHPVRTHAERLRPVGKPGDTLVLVDQFEEVFTLCTDPAERAEFIDLLLTSQDPASRLRVVLGVRADFYSRSLEHPELVQVVREAGIPVGPPSREGLREVIVRPATARGLTVERTLTAQLLDEVAGEPGGLPLLSHALLETWRRRSGRMLTLKAYEAAGGVRGAIAQTAEDAYGSLSTERADVARLVMLRLVTPGEGAQDTRRPVHRAELDFAPEEEVDAVLERLVSARLLTLDDGTVELAHEALITAWPRLAGWIDGAREHLVVHRRLTDAARTWDDLGREPGALYRGTRLATASEQLSDNELTPLERDFLTASEAAFTAESRRRRALIAVLAVLVVLALVGGITAWQQSRTSNRRQVEAEARRIAAVADGMRYSDPVRAVQLSVAAWRLSQTPETRSALIGTMTQKERDVFAVFQDDDDGSVLRHLSDNGRTIMEITANSITTWDVPTHRRIRTYSGPGKLLEESGESVVSPDGGTLALLMDDGVRLWDIRQQRVTSTLPADQPYFANFSRTGRALVTQEDEGTGATVLHVWDIGSGRPQLRLPLLVDEAMQGSAVSADGRWLAVCTDRRPVQLWDLDTDRRMPSLWTDETGSKACHFDGFDFSPDSRRIALATPTAVRVWDPRTGKEYPQMETNAKAGLRFSPDGDFLTTTSPEAISLWRVSEPDEPVFRYPLAGPLVFDVRLDVEAGFLRYLLRNGTTVRTVSVGSAVTGQWYTEKQAPDNVLLSPDGTSALTVRRDRPNQGFQLRHGHAKDADALPGESCASLPPGTAPGTESATATEDPTGYCWDLMAFSGDSRYVAYGPGWTDSSKAPVRQLITVWDAQRQRRHAAFDIPGVQGIGLSPDGRTLAAGTYDGIELWDTVRRKRTKTIPGSLGDEIIYRPDGGALTSGRFEGDFVDLSSGRVASHPLADVFGTASAFSPDGTRLAVGDGLGRVTVWDGAGRKRLAVLSGTHLPAASAYEAVSELAFSPDGSTLAVGGRKGTVQLWDVASNQPLGSALPTAGEPVLSLAFSPEGDTLSVAGRHKYRQQYNIAPAHLVQEACERAGAGLSEEDWHTYLPDVPYQRTC
ncbi:NACHT and WD repeat domain-containing protein [Streptomyces pharetrae]